MYVCAQHFNCWKLLKKLFSIVGAIAQLLKYQAIGNADKIYIFTRLVFKKVSFSANACDI